MLTHIFTISSAFCSSLCIQLPSDVTSFQSEGKAVISSPDSATGHGHHVHHTSSSEPPSASAAWLPAVMVCAALAGPPHPLGRPRWNQPWARMPRTSTILSQSSAVFEHKHFSDGHMPLVSSRALILSFLSISSSSVVAFWGAIC